MIVRVLGEGQYELTAEHAERIEGLDGTLSQAVAAGDEAWFTKALEALLAEVRSGRPVDAATIVPSDLAVPAEGSSLAEVRALLDEDTDEDPTEKA